jgi:glycine oxidase
VNITVVGAGVVGCAVAYELASRGARVRLIDPRGPGRGATGASAGILAPLIEGHSTALLRLGTCSVALWDDFIRRIRSESGQTVEYERSGTLHVALNDTQAGELSTLAGTFTSADVPHTVLDARDAAKLEPGLSRRATMAMLVPQHGYVGTVPLIDAL